MVRGIREPLDPGIIGRTGTGTGDVRMLPFAELAKQLKLAINGGGAGGGGTGDVVGPASAVDSDFAQFDGTTGKLIKDGGLSRTTDGTLAGNSDLLIPSEKAVKTYVDAHTGAALLTTNHIFVGDAGGHAADVAMSGDASIVASGALSVNHLSHVTDGSLANSGLTNSSIILNGHAVSLGGSLTLAPGDLALTSGHLYVGNASNVAADVAMSGDATMSNTGALTLANTAVTPATYGDATHVPQLVVDSKGRLTGVTNVLITQPTGANPTGTGSDTATNGTSPNFMRSDATFAIQKASSSVFGLAKVDNVTITASGGVFSATGTPVGGAMPPICWTVGLSPGASSSAFATKGNLIKPLANFSITKVLAYIAAISGQTYFAGIYVVNSSLVIQSVVATSASQGPGTGNQTLVFPCAANLVAGTLYAVVITRTDATSTTSLPIAGNTQTGSIHFVGAPLDTTPLASIASYGIGLNLASVLPAVTNTFSQFNGGHQMALGTY
jgi:hypothetical protein